MKTIAIAGTFDSKGEEFLFIKDKIESLGFKTLMIHTGVFEPKFMPDVSNDEIFKLAGVCKQEIVLKRDRALATEVLSKGMKLLLPKLYQEGKFDGIITFGGSGGTSLVAPAMQLLPIGVPKVCVSTMAGGDVSPYVGTSDIVMMPSVVDVAGLNKISRTIFTNGCLIICGMVGLKDKLNTEYTQTKPLIAATMFGVTTPFVEEAKAYLETKGYEVLVFHATGVGGRTMEQLIRDGYFTAVLDITTTEWCDEICGGVLSARKERLSAAIDCKLPQVVSVGALDMVNFGAFDTVPEKYKNRNLYKHNPTVTLMRTTVEENILIGKALAKKWNNAKRKMTLFLPKQGVSAIDKEGQSFDGKTERKALFDTLKSEITNPNVEIIEVDLHINDKEFAIMCAKRLLELII